MVVYPTSSSNILIQCQRTLFLSVTMFRAADTTFAFCLWFGCSVLTDLPLMKLGLPFQATVKPAGDHLCAICWNEIYILGLDYLVVSFCVESTLWVVSNKPCTYSKCQP